MTTEALPPSTRTFKDWVLGPIQMPTEDELRENSLRWHDQIEITRLDRLPSELLALGPKTRFIPIDPTRFLDDYEQQEGEYFLELAQTIDNLVGWNPHFFKLCTRAPKDYTFGSNPLTCSGKEVVYQFINSMRVVDDLMRFRHLPDELQPTIAIREPMMVGCELRAFIRDGDLIAASIYDYYGRPNNYGEPDFDGLAARFDKEPLRSSVEKYPYVTFRQLRQWWLTNIKPFIDASNYVCDVNLKAAYFQSDGPTQSLQLKFQLIELNPWGTSDPCFLGNYNVLNNILRSDRVQTTEVDLAKFAETLTRRTGIETNSKIPLPEQPDWPIWL